MNDRFADHAERGEAELISVKVQEAYHFCPCQILLHLEGICSGSEKLNICLCGRVSQYPDILTLPSSLLSSSLLSSKVHGQDEKFR